MFYRVLKGPHRATGGIDMQSVHVDVCRTIGECTAHTREEEHVVVALLEGEGVSVDIGRNGDTPVTVPRPVGSVIFIPSCTPNTFRTFGGDATYVAVRLAPALLFAAAHKISWTGALPAQATLPFMNDAILAILREMAALSETPSPDIGDAINARAQALAPLLLKQFSEDDAASHPAGGLPPNKLLCVQDLIRAKIGAPISLEDMAATAGVSVERFRHAFKVSTGVSPYRYLTCERIKRAQDLLLHSDDSLAKVALACGFGSQAHFTSVFREAVGMTPGAYRRAGKS